MWNQRSSLLTLGSLMGIGAGCAEGKKPVSSACQPKDAVSVRRLDLACAALASERHRGA